MFINLTNSGGAGIFVITDIKLYVPVVTLSAQDNAKMLQQLKFSFKRTMYWNKYQSDPKTYAQNQYLNHLVGPSFQVVNRLFVLSFENENGRTSNSEYYFFFYLGYLSQPFTNHRTAWERGGYFFNSSLPLALPHAS